MMSSFIQETEEGHVNLEEALEANANAGKWALIAPDGRTWFNTDVVTLFAVLAGELRGEPNRFGQD